MSETGETGIYSVSFTRWWPVAFPKCRLPDDEPDARAGLSSERCLPLDSSVASDTPGARRPFDLQSQRTGVTAGRGQVCDVLYPGGGKGQC